MIHVTSPSRTIPVFPLGPSSSPRMDQKDSPDITVDCDRVLGKITAGAPVGVEQLLGLCINYGKSGGMVMDSDAGWGVVGQLLDYTRMPDSVEIAWSALECLFANVCVPAGFKADWLGRISNSTDMDLVWVNWLTVVGLMGSAPYRPEGDRMARSLPVTVVSDLLLGASTVFTEVSGTVEVADRWLWDHVQVEEKELDEVQHRKLGDALHRINSYSLTQCAAQWGVPEDVMVTLCSRHGIGTDRYLNFPGFVFGAGSGGACWGGEDRARLLDVCRQGYRDRSEAVWCDVVDCLPDWFVDCQFRGFTDLTEVAGWCVFKNGDAVGSDLLDDRAEVAALALIEAGKCAPVPVVESLCRVGWPVAKMVLERGVARVPFHRVVDLVSSMDTSTKTDGRFRAGVARDARGQVVAEVKGSRPRGLRWSPYGGVNMLVWVLFWWSVWRIGHGADPVRSCRWSGHPVLLSRVGGVVDALVLMLCLVVPHLLA